MEKPSLHKHIIQVWKKKKYKSLNIALIVHSTCPYILLRLAG